MRHRVKNKRFTRDANARKMLVRGLVRSYFEHGVITTTLEKAKETRRWADKLISTARTNTVASRRTLHEFFGQRDIVNTLVDKIAPATGKRTSGFSKLVRIGKRRGDNTELATLTLADEVKNLHTLKSGKQQDAKKAAEKPARRTKTAAQKKKDAAAKREAAKVTAKKPTQKMTAVATRKVQAQQRGTTAARPTVRKLAQKGQ